MILCVLLIVAVYMACGVLAYGITFADMQRRFPLLMRENLREDAGFAILFGVFGPLGLFVSYFMSGFAKYGMKFRITPDAGAPR